MVPQTRTCTLAGHAFVRLSGNEAAARRRSPGPACGKLSPALLKHADEQIVAALAAVLHAIDAYHLAPNGPEEFREWGVVGAARFIGRDIISRDIPDFLTEGPWGVSPHIIPHRSLHSPSGAISIALNTTGPNHGTGGSPGFEAEGLMSALSLLWGRRLPGVWLVLSRVCPPDAPCNRSGAIPDGTFAEAVALALVPSGVGARLEFDTNATGPALTFEAVRQMAEGGTWSLPCGRVRVVPAAGMRPATTVPFAPLPATP
jgi:hypothetical protein